MVTQEWKDRLTEAIKHYQEYLNLQHWEIRIKDDEPEREGNENPLASIFPIEGRQAADLRLSADFFLDSVKGIHNSLIHELLHLPSDRMRNHIRYLTRGMSGDLKVAVYDCMTLEVEHFTDHYTACFAKLIPIPDCLFAECSKDLD